MKIKTRTSILEKTCAVLLMLGLHSTLQAAAISIISSSIAVEGRAAGNLYSGSNSGSTSGTTADLSTWSASSSGSITTTGAVLNAVAELESGPGNDWINVGYSQVSLTSAFQPLTPNLTFTFTGSTGYNPYESWINYSLTDLTASTSIISSQSTLSYTANLTLNVNHQYQLQLVARSAIGDFREGYANLNLQIVPEPASTGLLAVSLTGMILRRSRKPV